MTVPSSLVGDTFRPKLRPGLAVSDVGEGVLLTDRLRVGSTVQLTPFGFEIVKRFDGSRTLQELQVELTRLTGGSHVSVESLVRLAEGLDSALLLDRPAFWERIGGPIRKPTCIGCYDADPKRLRKQLKTLFTAKGGPGLPDSSAALPHRRLRAALLPHMDYTRGNVTYGWGFKELVENTDATVFVIVATSHYSGERFTLTRQHFETPLGVVESDPTYIDRIAAEYGDGLFDDHFAHIPEHSIELEVVLLQYLLEGKRPFRIVPLLVGSFGDCVEGATSPADAPDIARMVAALQKAEAACGESVCYLISGDLAHIGPKFGDEQPAAGPWLDDSRKQDQAIAKQIAAADHAGYFTVIAAERDERRICGLPPTWLTLAAAKPTTGKVLHYQQFVHAQGHESVSFAAAAFYE